jgi:CRISPR-associated endonuclease Csn1
MGTNSLGWCVLQIDKNGNPLNLLNWGSRIFDDGREPAKKDVPGESSAVQRRDARGMRRRYDRKLMRKKATLSALIRHGLLPEDETTRRALITFTKAPGKKSRDKDKRKLFHVTYNESKNPLKLRAEALERKLDPYEIGRALFHLQQRRGFKSNRKDAQKGDNKIDGMKLVMRDFTNELDANQLTLGQFLYQRYQKRMNTRVRPREEGSKMMYDGYYPTRKIVEDEFNAIWQAQSKHYPTLLTEDAHKAIHKAIFYQRPLKPQEVGKCLLTEDRRMAWAMPSAQRFRIIKEVNNLKIRSPEDFRYKGAELEQRQNLTFEQKRKLFEELCANGSKTFGSIRKLLNIASGTEFNLEVTRDKLLGDKTAEIMRREDYFGKQWDEFTLKQQDSIIEKLLCDNPEHPDFMEDETLIKWLIDEYSLTAAQAENVANANLPPSHARFGKTVIDFILPEMIAGMQEDKAIALKPEWHHSQHYTGEILSELPYYGELLSQHVVPMPKSGDPLVKEFGRINNPTVHIALNQLRRLMNRLKDRYGVWPQEISLEMARDLKKGRTEIAEIIKNIDINTKNRKKWKEEIEKYKAEANAEDYSKMKLWEELAKDPTHRKCVYTGDTISIEMLFNGKTQIDHILPYSQTLDNTSANLILVTVEGNQIKKNQTPYEAFKHQSGKYSYEEICKRIDSLPQSKKWRFQQNAMDVFASKAKTIVMKSSLGTDIIVDTGLESFTARQLNDTSYIAKLAKKYLAYACEKGERGVQATTGTLTGLLRKSWGLNAVLAEDDDKNRNDHRHHAIDALVIAMTTRSMVKSVADAAKKEEETGIKLVKHIPKPWSDYDVATLKQRAEEIIISHKPDHGSPANNGSTSGRLHEDTYYGFIEKKNRTHLLCLKTQLPSLAKDAQNKRFKLSKIFTNLSSVIDRHLRNALIKAFDSCLSKSYEQELYQMAKQYNDLIIGKIHLSETEIKKIKKENEEKFDRLEKDFDDNKFNKILSDFHVKFGNEFIPVRSARVYEEPTNEVLVNVKTYEDGTPWKLAIGGSNQRAEIYCPKSGKNAGKWQIEFMKTFDVNKKDFVPAWRKNHPDAEYVMTLYKGDIVAYEAEAVTHIMKITSLPNSGQIFLIPHHLSKATSKTPPSIKVSGMQERKFRKLYVEIDGSVYDPAGILTSINKKVNHN